MPQLGQYQYLLDIVFFLYPDQASAQQGRGAGGTGFFVTVPFKTNPTKAFVYAVTNWHVAVELGCSVIRVNTRNGPPAIFEFEPHEWEFLPNHHDIAVVQVMLDQGVHRMEAIDIDSFCLTTAEVKAWQVNAGEDIFMLGRFLDYDGVEANVPSMRFGNISMMEARYPQPNGFAGPSLVVDMHSRTGFSGSPVFVYRTSGSRFSDVGTIVVGGHVMKLLGILWGQFPESWDVVDAPKGAAAQADTAVLDGKKIRGWSGMSLVAPAEAIRSLLNQSKLLERRATVEAQFRAGK